jgi:hypothetical protein
VKNDVFIGGASDGARFSVPDSYYEWKLPIPTEPHGCEKFSTDFPLYTNELYRREYIAFGGSGSHRSFFVKEGLSIEAAFDRLLQHYQPAPAESETLNVLRQVARLSEARIPAHMAPAQLDEIRDLVGAELWRLAKARKEREVAGC